jgi:putative transposase
MKNYGQGFDLLQLIDRKEFQTLCKKWEVDRYVRSFPTWKQVQILVLAYILKIESSREVELTFGVPKSTFCDANQERCAGFFEELCRLVLWKIRAVVRGRKIRRAIRNLLAIDSTECSVHGSAAKFPFWQAKKGGAKASVKLHVVWNVDGEWIEDFRITPGRKNDSPISKQFSIAKGSTYVFDRAYNDLGFWWKIVSGGAHLVSRLKKNSHSRWRHRELLSLSGGKDGVLWDGKWKPSYPVLRKAPLIPKDFTLRRIVYRDAETKNIFNFITSDFKAPAQEIANIYRRRWSVELLFRWLKGHLNIRYFSAKTTNAIRVHVAMAVLVQLLVQLSRIKMKAPGTLWDHLRRIRVALRLGGLQNQASPATHRRAALSTAILQP